MKKLLKRIEKILDKENFLVLNIFGMAGSGKTVLTNEIIHEFPSYQVRYLRDPKELKEHYTKNTIEVFEDFMYIQAYQTKFRIILNLMSFNLKPLKHKKLIRIIVTARKIDIRLITDYEHIKDRILFVSTGFGYWDAKEDSRLQIGIAQNFLGKIERQFKTRHKTRSYLILNEPMDIGRYKLINKTSFEHRIKK